jgi:hypothetical protein
LQTELKRRGLNDAWYALNYKGYQVNGDSAEITQVRRMREMHDHFEESQDMLAAATVNRARSEAREFSCATIHVIPDSLLNADALKAITELMAPRVVQRKSPREAVPQGGYPNGENQDQLRSESRPCFPEGGRSCKNE